MRLIVILVASLAAACGPKKGDVDPNATKTLEGDVEPPTCDVKGVKLRVPAHFKNATAGLQRAEDAPADPADPRDPVGFEETEHEYYGHELLKGIGGGHALITFGKDGKSKMIHAYLQAGVEDGEAVASRAYVKTDEFDVGNCEDPAVYVSKFTYVTWDNPDADYQHGTFVLRQAHRDSYCEGEPIPGTIAGCFRSK